MKKLFSLVTLLFISISLHAQIDPEEGCQLTSIQVASSSEEVIVLRHAAFFLFSPNTDQQTLWEISTIDDESIIATSDEDSYIMDLPPIDVTIEDTVVVDLTITNITGDVCKIRDTLRWLIIGEVVVDPPVPLYEWRSLDSIENTGTYFEGIASNTETIEENLVHIYPNPSTGRTTIDLTTIPTDRCTIQIYDCMGKLVSVYTKAAFQNSSLDINIQESGLYLVRIDLDGKTLTKRLLID